MNKHILDNIKQIDGNVRDKFLGVTKDEYDAYLSEYLASDDEMVMVVDYPNLIMQLKSIYGEKKAYQADDAEIKESVKSIGARN